MSRLSSLVWLTTNAIGTLLCFSAAVTFGILGNDYAVVWCSVACILAAANTYIRAVHFADKLEFWYGLKAISRVRDFGMCIGVIILGFFFFALFEVFYYKESIHAPVSKSKIIVAVWCFISAKYAFTLFWVGKKYVEFLAETRSLLEEE